MWMTAVWPHCGRVRVDVWARACLCSCVATYVSAWRLCLLCLCDIFVVLACARVLYVRRLFGSQRQRSCAVRRDSRSVF